MSKRTKRFFTIFLTFLLFSFVLNILTAKMSSSSAIFGKFAKQVAIVRIEGIILDCEEIIKEINTYRDDNNTAALLLRIDSPGGAVAPSQEIFNAVKKFAQKKPVVVSMGTAAASGAYYIASGANKIFANGTTLTGSIGVICELPRYDELLNKIGISIEVITAGKMKDAGSPVRELTKEEREYFYELLKDTHEQFIQDVAAGRNLDYDYLKTLAQGQIFTGNQALKLGLIDSLGTFEDAKSYILEICQLPSSTRFHENASYRNLFRFIANRTPLKNLIHFRRSGLYFLSEQLI
jgi:protease-4